MCEKATSMVTAVHMDIEVEKDRKPARQPYSQALQRSKHRSLLRPGLGSNSCHLVVVLET